MNIDKLQQKLSNFHNALLRLREVLDADPTDPFVYDATLQRFEFSYELGWKLISGDGFPLTHSGFLTYSTLPVHHSAILRQVVSLPP